MTLREKVCAVINNRYYVPPGVMAEMADAILALLSTADSEQREVWSFCPEDGFNVRVDEDGCCVACGAVAMGSAVDRLTRPAEQQETYPTSRLQPVNYEEAEQREPPVAPERWPDGLYTTAMERQMYMMGYEAALPAGSLAQEVVWLLENVRAIQCADKSEEWWTRRNALLAKLGGPK